jgi:hypothetical protein
MVRVAHVLPILLTAALFVGCVGYVPGEKAYWDAKVRELCAKDGGVQILEKWRLSAQDVSLLRRIKGKFSVPIESVAPPDSPAYAVITKEYIREGNPEVHRSEVTFVRRRDKAVLAKSVMYERVGGDFPSHAHPSSFACPDPRKIASDIQEVFIVEGEAK